MSLWRPILAPFPCVTPLSSAEHTCGSWIPLYMCAHKPMQKTPMYNPYKATTIKNDPVKWNPQMLLRTFQQCCYNMKAIFSESLYPRVIMSHTIVLGWQPRSSACPEAPMTSHKHIQTFTHSKCTNTGLMSTEPMLELKFLQQLLCRWTHLPKRGPLHDLGQNDEPWILNYHTFQIW